MPPIKHRFALAFLILVLVCGSIGTSCRKIDLYERVVSIPGHQWKGRYIPSFTFEISDTVAAYQLYVIVRHTEKYSYNNLWINLHTKSPDSTVSRAQYELPLATKDRGWLGTGMDDLYEHRVALTPINQDFYFRKAGKYTFRLQHIMREEPLRHMMNIGLRIEKKNR